VQLISLGAAGQFPPSGSKCEVAWQVLRRAASQPNTNVPVQKWQSHRLGVLTVKEGLGCWCRIIGAYGSAHDIIKSCIWNRMKSIANWCNAGTDFWDTVQPSRNDASVLWAARANRRSSHTGRMQAAGARRESPRFKVVVSQLSSENVWAALLGGRRRLAIFPGYILR